MKMFGDSFLASMLGYNMHNFINLMDDRGELVFSDRQSLRMERAMSSLEFGFGEGGYHASGFVRTTLPKGMLDLLMADAALENKTGSSTSGQASVRVGATW